MNPDSLFPSCSLDARRQARAALDNIFLPLQAVVRRIIPENPLVKTYTLDLADELSNSRFSFAPGQFMMVSMPHLGEAPISFSSPPGNRGFDLTIRNSGRLTAAVHSLAPGDLIGVRGPYGRAFPAELAEKELLVVAGGIGMAPLRPVIEQALARPERANKLRILYGSRTPDDFCFRRDFRRWQEQGARLLLTVDRGDPSWDGPVGLVTGLLDQVELNPETDLALICGPELMIRAVIRVLVDLGLPPERIFTTMERQMKCGVGLCGHCHHENHLVCVDGPVFRSDEIAELWR